ncbi:putative bifunctional diguanylate cyclase/phosphodiesterase [Piscinibacter sakaiensis]|uniref:Diguanylate cyclase/phosphodiesterase with PAS/PAC sensor(S) n=1 Tax=Piscinibacter sakaiensis TaxID=1547922 RepID=A0A0K8P8B1_PISS1|nr:bifunctional diguanylate cyclase/phosphodiesterase [Piscinibacter sakaiensis]GAP38739.1 diguanylate cyclase/phosphodiesterase with PAS/PAC sensor(s) [Piscinibacter sakaiensis]
MTNELSATLATSYHPGVVALSYLIAAYASYVALDLANRVRNQEGRMARAWWIGGSLAMGCGIWAMHFVGMLAMSLPIEVGYDHVITGVSGVAAVVVSGIALQIASRPRLTALSLGVGALSMGAGICVMHYTGMAAMEMAPGIRWDWRLVGASAAIAVSASAVALLIFFWMRGLGRRAAAVWQVVAALVMGAAICGMHYTGMAAAGFVEGSLCLSAGDLAGDRLGVLVAIAAFLLLTFTVLTATIDARMQSKTERLAASLRSANDELQQIAFRDALTGLPNRLLFDDRVSSAVARCTEDRLGLAVLFIDLDGFKPVNDSFGHALGDRVLQSVAQRILGCAGRTDTVARVGGDEFVMLLDADPDTTSAAQVAQRVIDALGTPLAFGEHEVRLSCSIGIAMFPANGPREQLLAHADAAMYAAKRAGGAGFAFFEPHMNAGVREQLELQTELRHALQAGGQLELHYQPKIGTRGGRISGVEALLRWRHPTRGLIPPGAFIPVAERFGLIGPLGFWVIEEACRQMRSWLDQGLRLRTSINLSVHQLRQDDLVPRIQRALQRERLEPTLLTFEITESMAMEDSESTLRVVENLGRIGVKVSIDDFGTGYSSLSYLRQLRTTELKIDRSFVQDLETSADARAIVEAVVRLAHSLGLRVVAEGVETQAQREVLTQLRCDELQGFLFAKPMPARVMTLWASDDEERPQNLAFADSAFVEA